MWWWWVNYYYTWGPPFFIRFFRYLGWNEWKKDSKRVAKVLSLLLNNKQVMMQFVGLVRASTLELGLLGMPCNIFFPFYGNWSCLEEKVCHNGFSRMKVNTSKPNLHTMVMIWITNFEQRVRKILETNLCRLLLSSHSSSSSWSQHYVYYLLSQEPLILLN